MLDVYYLREFQSTPVITDGRTAANVTEVPVADSFNPRPSSLTGEPLHGALALDGPGVSIHARHH